RLVDDHAGGRVAGETQLVQGDPEHVPVDARHLVDGRPRGQLGDLLVELAAVLEHPLDDPPCEGRGGLGQPCPEDAALPDRLDLFRPVHVDLEERLERETAGRMAAAAVTAASLPSTPPKIRSRMPSVTTSIAPSMALAAVFPVKPSVTTMSVVPRRMSRPSTLPKKLMSSAPESRACVSCCMRPPFSGS